MEAMMSNMNNGRIQWSKAEVVGTKALSHADLTIYRTPFVLSPDAVQRLSTMTLEESDNALHNMMWRGVIARNTGGPTWGGVSHAIMGIEYVAGKATGFVTIGRSVGIGD
jgi:hypothetical protein